MYLAKNASFRDGVGRPCLACHRCECALPWLKPDWVISMDFRFVCRLPGSALFPLSASELLGLSGGISIVRSQWSGLGSLTAGWGLNLLSLNGVISCAGSVNHFAGLAIKGMVVAICSIEVVRFAYPPTLALSRASGQWLQFAWLAAP